MCLLQGSSRSSRYYWLLSSTQGIVRRGKCFPNYYTYRIKGTTRGEHVRRGKRFTNNYTSRIKGTTRGKHSPERNIYQHESTKHSWWATCSGWGYESTWATCWGWREESVRHHNFWPKQKQWTIVCTYMYHLFWQEQVSLNIWKKCAHQWNNECLNSTGKFTLFPSGIFHRGYYNDKSTSRWRYEKSTQLTTQLNQWIDKKIIIRSKAWGG